MSFKPMMDGFDLELIGSVDTAVEKAIAEYEIPFADGGILDDMGVKARRFQIRTIWRRGNYEAYEYFIEHVKLNQLNRFVHPELGAVNGRVKSVNVVHDARRRCAEISVEFLEDVTPDVVPAYDPPLVADLEDGFNKSAAALIDSAAADLAAGGLDTDAEVDMDKPLAGQVRARTVSARAFLARVNQSITNLRGAFNRVLNPIESAVGMFNYGLSLPGAVIGAVAGAVERAAMIAGGALSSPVTFISSFRASVARLCQSVPMFRNTILAAAGNIAALFVGKTFASDEANRAVLRRVEDTPRWRPDGTALNVPAAPQVLSANELDESLARVREMIQEGLGAARAMGNTTAASVLADQANDLARYVGAVKIERDRITTVEVESDTPLHLICLRHGLPYSYADRICTINNFQNPTFCAGPVRIYERHG